MATSYAVVVPLRSGQAARELVLSLGIGRGDLKLGKREGEILIPIREPIEFPMPEARIEVAEFDASHPPGSYKDHVHVAEALRPCLPSSFDIVGDLVLIKVPADLERHAEDIGRAILAAHPNVRGVFHDAGVSGPLRLRSLRPLAGETRTQTVHSEYGVRLRVDLATAYFSPRLANEHHRVANAVRPGEVFVDATAGVGPFSILAAKRRVASKLWAFDLNPQAVELLRENLVLNRLEGAVEVHLGDAKERIPEIGTFHRAVVNLPHSGADILNAAWRGVEPGGTLHYLSIVAESALRTAGDDVARAMERATGRPGRAAASHVVHPYSATDRLTAVDFIVR